MENNEITDWELLVNRTTIGAEGFLHVKKRPSFPLFGNISKAEEMIKKVSVSIDKTIESLEWHDEYTEIAEWMVDPKGKGLLLTGDPGTLKTTIATLVIPFAFWNKHNWKIRPISSFEIMDKMDLFDNVPVIIVDDVGEEPPVNDFGMKYESFSRLVDFCEKNSKVLIATTNLDSKGLEKRYGERTMDRLDLLCKPVKIQRKSLRK